MYIQAKGKRIDLEVCHFDEPLGEEKYSNYNTRMIKDFSIARWRIVSI